MAQTIKVQDNLQEITSCLESEGYKRRMAFTNYPQSVRLDGQWFDITEEPGTITLQQFKEL